MWTSSLDLDWNDMAVKPVFLPFIHTVTKYLADYAEAPASLTVGQVIPAPRKGAGRGRPATRGGTIAIAPVGNAGVGRNRGWRARAERTGLLRRPHAGCGGRHGDGAGRQRRSHRIGSVGAGSARAGGGGRGARGRRNRRGSARRGRATMRRRRRSGCGGICSWRAACCSRARRCSPIVFRRTVRGFHDAASRTFDRNWSQIIHDVRRRWRMKLAMRGAAIAAGCVAWRSCCPR